MKDLESKLIELLTPLVRTVVNEELEHRLTDQPETRTSKANCSLHQPLLKGHYHMRSDNMRMQAVFEYDRLDRHDKGQVQDYCEKFGFNSIQIASTAVRRWARRFGL